MMPDMAVIGGLAASLNAAVNIAKAMIGVHDAVVFQEKVVELQQVLLSAQSSAITAQSDQFSLLDEIRGLKEQLAKVQAWDATKQRYHLVEIEEGQFAYALNQSVAVPGEPAHRLCSNCFDRGEKSILQTERRNPGRHTVYVCHRCNSDIFSTRSGGRDSVHLPSRK
jgi:hypothetical protein